jgi:hypothetical protein
LADAATANASATKKAMFRNSEQDRNRSDPKGGDPGHDQLTPLRRLSLLDHVSVEIMGNRRCRRQSQPRDHCKDGGEGDR